MGKKQLSDEQYIKRHPTDQYSSILAPNTPSMPLLCTHTWGGFFFCACHMKPYTKQALTIDQQIVQDNLASCMSFSIVRMNLGNNKTENEWDYIEYIMLEQENFLNIFIIKQHEISNRNNRVTF